MNKFIIVDKDSPGNQWGKSYTVTYQLVGNPTRYKIDLYCYSKDSEGYKYCYIEGHTGYGIETMQDKDEFLTEFYKFQKGGSYRKTHPIQYSEEEIDYILVENKKIPLVSMEALYILYSMMEGWQQKRRFKRVLIEEYLLSENVKHGKILKDALEQFQLPGWIKRNIRDVLY